MSVAMSPVFGARVASEDVQVVGAYLRVSTGGQNEANQAPDVERLIKAQFPKAKIDLVP